MNNKFPRSPFSINENLKNERKSILGIPIRAHSLILISTNAPHLQISTSSTRRETANLDSGWIPGAASGTLPLACIWLSEILSLSSLKEGSSSEKFMGCQSEWREGRMALSAEGDVRQGSTIVAPYTPS